MFNPFGRKDPAPGDRKRIEHASGDGHSELTVMGGDSTIDIRVVCADSEGKAPSEVASFEGVPFGIVVAPLPEKVEGKAEIVVTGLCSPKTLPHIGAAMISFLEEQGALLPALILHRANLAIIEGKGAGSPKHGFDA